MFVLCYSSPSRKIGLLTSTISALSLIIISLHHIPNSSASSPYSLTPSFAGFGYAFNTLPTPDTANASSDVHNPPNTSDTPSPHSHPHLPPQQPSNELAKAFSVIFTAATHFSFFIILQVWFPFLRMFVSIVCFSFDFFLLCFEVEELIDLFMSLTGEMFVLRVESGVSSFKFTRAKTKISN